MQKSPRFLQSRSTAGRSFVNWKRSGPQRGNNDLTWVLLTYDVKACYPSIDIDDALKILAQVYPHIFLTRDGFWIKVLETIMKLSFIIRKTNVYRQISGTAMGTAAVPPFANLYLFRKLRRVFYRHQKFILFQKRDIDHGLMLVREAEPAERLCDELEDASNLRFTFDWKWTSAVYLDIEIYKGRRFEKEGILENKIYTKPISKFLYLRDKSNHPESVFTVLIKGECETMDLKEESVLLCVVLS